MRRIDDGCLTTSRSKMTFSSFCPKNTKRRVSLLVPDCEHPLDGRNTRISVKEEKTANECGAKTCNSSCCARLIDDPFTCGVGAFSTQVKDSPTRHQDKTESEPDYKINHCFNIGNRDGYRDDKKNERREHHLSA